MQSGDRPKAENGKNWPKNFKAAKGPTRLKNGENMDWADVLDTYFFSAWGKGTGSPRRWEGGGASVFD